MENSTVRYYNANAQAYYASTVGLDMSRLYEPFVRHLSPGARVLDAGCGSGRDSLFFKQQGFQVTAFDASKEMAELASELLGHKVLLMTFEDLHLSEQYDGIWACASLLHVPREQLGKVLVQLTKHLADSGIFYMSFKYGDQEYWQDGRYLNCLDERALEALIKQIPGLSIQDLFITTDVRQDRASERWLNAYLLKDVKRV